MLGFSPLAGATLASTGDSSQSVTVSISAAGGIVRSSNNLSTPMFRGAVGFLPEETLFEVVVNGRILGDIDNNGSFNTNDVSNAFAWEAGTSSAAVTAYIEGPMTAYMLANQAAYEGINIAFSSVSMSGVVGTGVTVEADQNVDVNNRLQIAQVSNPPANLTNGISAAVSGQQPESTLFNTVVNGRNLGDLNDDGSVNVNDLTVALQWDNDSAILPVASASYILGPMNDYMISNFSSFGPAGIGLIFNSPTGVGTVGTGVIVETNKNVATLNNRLQIAQINANNLIVGIGAAVGSQQPEATLFNTLVNGRKLGDLNGAIPTTVNTQDVFIAQKWDFNSASLSLASASYISGPMNDYMIANFSSFGPAGIGLIFNSPTGVGTVGTGVTVETGHVIDVDNVGITATGVVDVDGVDVEADQVIDVNNVGITATGVVDVDGVDVEADQVIDVNNRQEIARTTNNLSTPILRAAVGFLPEETLFNIVVNGRRLGDIDNSGNPVNSQDATLAGQWEAGTSSAAITAYIEAPMTTYMLGNISAYEGINIAFTTMDATGVVDNVTVVEGTGVSVSLDNINITATGVVDVDGVDVETGHVIDVNNIGITATGIVDVDGVDVETGHVIDVDNVDITATGIVDVDGVDVETGHVIDVNNIGITATGIVDVDGVDVETGHVIDVDNVGITATGVVDVDGVDVETGHVIDVDNIGITATGVVDVDGVTVVVGTGVTVSLDNEDITATGIVDVDGVDVETGHVIDVNNIGITATGIVDVDGVDVETGQVVDVDNVGLTATGVVDADGVDVETDQIIDVNNIGITATGIVEEVLVWSAIIPDQTANFILISPSQTSGFGSRFPLSNVEFHFCYSLSNVRIHPRGAVPVFDMG